MPVSFQSDTIVSGHPILNQVMCTLNNLPVLDEYIFTIYMG